jgi:hypothetical protein
MSVTEDKAEELPVIVPPKKRNQLARIAAVSALLVALLGGGAFAWNSHVQSEYDKRDDAISLLRISADKDKRESIAEHRREIASLTFQHEIALDEAVKAEKDRGVRATRRAVRKQQSKMRREVKAARDAGFSSGSVAGFATGHELGEDAGLVKGSDGLDCSDDIDVYWLPPCY